MDFSESHRPGGSPPEDIDNIIAPKHFLSIRENNCYIFPVILNFAEYCQFRQNEIKDVHSTGAKAHKRRLYREFLQTGGYPEIPGMKSDLVNKDPPDLF
ncbi:MAG: hypothetical protein Q7J16_06070 [Candidatus Cloacimonadales bacterium]|nr:hypothetical protein [Candidatus Cloacimonadales bacterium]